MSAGPEATAGRRRLLAVDDNKLILRVIEDFFVLKGWSVTTAENVAAARHALAQASPDVIVSDILMPEIDGWTFFEDVRKRQETAWVPFVFLTVERELPQRLRGLHLGADDYMTKPFAVEELEARIERLLERSVAAKRARADDSNALLAGSAEHLAISDLLQLLALNGKEGTVELTRRGDEGRIEFVRGRIVDAAAGSARGTKALYRMLGWTDATFRVMPREHEIGEATITSPTATVLMDGLVSLDEWSRWAGLLPGAETRIELAADARSRLHGQTLRPVEFELLSRARSGITVASALEDIPHPDTQVAEAICTLLARGIVRSVTARGEKGAPVLR
jgi:DNA-binding response OmpR family regulator